MYDEVQRMKLLIDQTYRLATVAQQNIYYYVFALLQTNTHSFTHTQRERGNKSREKRTKIHSTPHTLIGLKYTQTYCSYDESQKKTEIYGHNAHFHYDYSIHFKRSCVYTLLVNTMKEQ